MRIEVEIKTLKRGSVFFFNNYKYTVSKKRNETVRQYFCITASHPESTRGSSEFHFDGLIVEVEV